MSFLDLAAQNLVSPMVLFFAIGFKGGAEVAANGLSGRMLAVMGAGIALSFVIPVLGYAYLRAASRLPSVDAAAICAHYGSISIVTFVAATEAVRGQGLPFDGYLVAVAAVMETPAIRSALYLARRSGDVPAGEGIGALLREVALNASVVMLVGAFLIGWATGPRGLAMIAPFTVDPFRGVLCLFLLDMGLVAGRGMRDGIRHLSPPVLAFGIGMPLVSAALATLAVWPIGLSPGSAALFITLAASASYIAVPAAMRLALPQARPALYLTLSLGVTFPFNLAIGIPLYLALAARVGL